MLFLRNLFRHKARSLITLFGVAVGVALYVAVAAILGDLGRETHDVIAGYETDVAVQARGAGNPIASRISADELRALVGLFGDDVTPFAIGTLREEWNSYALLLGTTPRMLNRFGLADGRAIRPGEREVVVGIELARRLGLGLGAELSFGGERWRVVGTYSVGNRFVDGAVVTDLRTAQRLLRMDESVNVALVRAGNRGDPRAVADTINGRLPRLLALASDDFIRTLRIFKTIDAFAKALALIAFVGSVAFVTNTLLMAVSERTRELGILMAIGWSPLRIVRMLLAEGLALCLLGGALGNGLALVALWLLNGSRLVAFGWVPVTLPREAVLASLGLVGSVAVVACVWPAVVVARLSPAAALRHE